MIKESGIVERLNDSGLFGRASWSEVELLCKEAATLIAELQAELGYKNNAISDYILGDDNSELARAKASEAYMGGVLGRELELHEQTRKQLAAAESSLHRVRGENVGLLRAAIAVCWFDWSENDTDAVEAIDRLGKAIRSLNKTGLDSEKTAESEHSPSTLNAETECLDCKGSGENLSNPMSAGQCNSCEGSGHAHRS